MTSGRGWPKGPLVEMVKEGGDQGQGTCWPGPSQPARRLVLPLD